MKRPAVNEDMVQVLIVDDSRTEQIQLANLLTRNDRIAVAGSVAGGIEALEFLKHTRPEVIVMDLHMPQYGGLEVTQAIMERFPTPIIIVTADRKLATADSAFKLLEAGALAVLEKPFSFNEGQEELLADQLRRLVMNLARVKLVHRLPRGNERSYNEPAAQAAQLGNSGRTINCIVIGASTGGPPVLKQILCGISSEVEAPILIAQHMVPGFLDGFAHWIGKEVGRPVIIPRNGLRVEDGMIYLGPGDQDMSIDQEGKIALVSPSSKTGQLTSVDTLFQSVAERFGGSVIAILLTGMGSDGARGLLALRKKGAITIVQSAETAAVNGMPGAAVKLDAAVLILPPDQIPGTVNMFFSKP